MDDDASAQKKVMEPPQFSPKLATNKLKLIGGVLCYGYRTCHKFLYLIYDKLHILADCLFQGLGISAVCLASQEHG